MGTCNSCFAEEIYRMRTPIESIPEMLEARLCDVVVYSSHNSYIRTLQIGSAATIDALNIALKRGARCIELDIFREKANPSQVFVAHGQQKPEGDDLLVTTKLPLKDAFTFLATNAWNDTSDPLFLALEINVHEDIVACNAIADLINTTFSSSQLLPPGKKITPSTRLQTLLNKLVIITGGGVPLQSTLNDTTNAVWGTEFQNTHHKDSQDSLLFGKSVVRIYPAGDVKGALSLNYDPLPFLQKGGTFVSMNLCTNDAHMRTYDMYFRNESIMLSDAVKYS